MPFPSVGADLGRIGLAGRVIDVGSENLTSGLQLRDDHRIGQLHHYRFGYPKRRAVEMSAEEGQGAIQINWGAPVKLTDGEPAVNGSVVPGDLGNGEHVMYNGSGQEGGLK